MSQSKRYATWQRDGYLSPVRIISATEASRHRRALEDAESEAGPQHYLDKAHTVLTSPLELARHPAMLDVVESLIGPDVLLYNVVYIVKEPHSPAHVSWHQDLTYWGLDSDEQVSAWLALAPATEQSGCMRMIPGSHKHGRYGHAETNDASNVLKLGQTVAGIDDADAQLCSLQPGEASFHHGWTLHSSGPNSSDDRRIGLNIQYLATRVRQMKHDEDSAMLVRGVDNYGHFAEDIPANRDLDPEALARRDAMVARFKDIYEASGQS
ncbi:MAG: phytanoyl-CoA dioxygenase family protein [Gammaproteobacteria bacterium]|nr:phytanoyl-CoA dioxygenase family protein [Gammaproteobacteria bacterium]NNC58333.1 phytanoyl-CoA dioxygenase family protein [Woeseiaceae bacterium]